jgi:hypothetical protein
MISTAGASSLAGAVAVVASAAGCDCPRAGAAAPASTASVTTNRSLAPLVIAQALRNRRAVREAQVGHASTIILSVQVLADW